MSRKLNNQKHSIKHGWFLATVCLKRNFLELYINKKMSKDIQHLVSGFGDTGSRMYQIFDGKLNKTLPEELTIHHVLITGISGSGKTLLLVSIAKHFGCEIRKVNLGRVLAAGYNHSGLKQQLYNQASTTSDKPVLVWLADVELFTGIYGRVVQEFLKTVSQGNMPGCIVALTSRHQDKVSGALKVSCDDHIHILPLGKEERLNLCRWYIGRDDGQLLDIVNTSDGKTVAELFALLDNDNTPKRLGKSVGWNDIGGLDHVIEEIKESILWPILYRDEFKRLGIKPARGILLYGPPGTGKTMLAKAAAAEITANFISVAIPELIKGEVGESEKALATIFQSAVRSPSILFLDEIEAIFGHRKQAGEVGKKLISQLFLEIDSIPDEANMVILAATNAPELMDPSILRSGRLDKKIHIPRPDYTSRLDILHKATNHLMIEDGDAERREQLLKNLAEKELSGAEIKSLVRCACYAAIERSSSNLNEADFEAAFAAIGGVGEFH